jgi:hypothetical protein
MEWQGVIFLMKSQLGRFWMRDIGGQLCIRMLQTTNELVIDANELEAWKIQGWLSLSLVCQQSCS